MTDILWLDVTDSTNSEAARRPELDNLSVIVSSRQTEGRGQRGNIWHSEPGMNLTFSIILRYGQELQVPVEKEFSICEAVALSLSDFLVSKFGIDARIKWPNDIYVGKKKICGILIEHKLSEAFLDSSIIGIGLNVNQTIFPSDLPNATSIRMETGKVSNLKETLEEYLEIFYERFLSLSECDSGELVHREYISRQCLL